MRIPQIVDRNKNSIILLALYIPEPGSNDKWKISIRGTGFITSSDGKFITCAHVYKKIPSQELAYLEVSAPGKIDDKGITHYDRYKTELIKLDEENDFALMKIISDRTDFKVITELGDSELVREGDEIVFIGYPLATELLAMQFGITMSANHCIISSVKRRGVDGSLHFFMVDTHINNGSSGSPVFSIDNGKVVGVASGKITSKIQTPDGKVFDIPANMGICRPAKYIIDLVNKK